LFFQENGNHGGKYSKRMRESSNIVVLKPEFAQAFPNGDAVDNALLSLIKIAQKSAGLTKANGADAKNARLISAIRPHEQQGKARAAYRRVGGIRQIRKRDDKGIRSRI
jgi:hypothetical protein